MPAKIAAEAQSQSGHDMYRTAGADAFLYEHLHANVDDVVEKLGKQYGGWYPFSARSEEHTSELQSLAYLVCRILISEEHTSELQSLAYIVCRLLLEKKKKNEKKQLTCNKGNQILRLLSPTPLYVFMLTSTSTL